MDQATVICCLCRRRVGRAAAEPQGLLHVCHRCEPVRPVRPKQMQRAQGKEAAREAMVRQG